METIRGKASRYLDGYELRKRLAEHSRVVLDLGTGDGKYALCHARAFPSHFVIGVDACRENLHAHSRAGLSNLVYLIANAQSLPSELDGLISHITINFPWGSLLESLLSGDADLYDGLVAVSQAKATIDVRLNGGALAEAGATLEEGAMQVFANLQNAGWRMQSPLLMDARALHNFPSAWAKRLAFGRDPRAIHLSGSL